MRCPIQGGVAQSRLIRNGETAAAFDNEEHERHCDFVEESGIHLGEQNLRDRRDICWLVTQIMTPTRPKKAIERTARTVFFLPENAYVRNIRMTEDVTNTSVNNSSQSTWT